MGAGTESGLSADVGWQSAPCAQANRGTAHRFICPDCPPGVLIVGHSEGISKALAMIRKVSLSRCSTILILGETGTGKELAARAVHAWRCGDPEKFVAINCAALTANLLESELFGHVRGAFTGADRDKTGLFELAGDGTIFLDEISEMPVGLQAKLLRVVQERTFRKVGGTKDLTCTATIVASSNRDLAAEVKAGRFRKDLYYRLAVFPITLPPLRSPDRRQDIPLLAEFFLANSSILGENRLRGLTPGAQEVLTGHDWPGNVRELRNVIERAMILEQTDWITPASLLVERFETTGSAEDGRQEGRGPAAQQAPRETRRDFSLEAAEREFIVRALKETGWQRTRAAALLGITRATLHAKLKRYDIRVPSFRGASAAGSPGDPASAGEPQEFAEAEA